MKYFKYYLILIALVFSGCASTPTVTEPSQEEIAAQIDHLIKNWHEYSGVQTSLIAIDTPETGKLVFANGDLSNIPSGQSVETTNFRTFSINKTFIAASIFALEASGQLDLDDPLSKFFPNVTHSDLVTVENLLNHSSGYVDIYKQPEIILASIEDVTHDFDNEEVFSYLEGQDLLFSPGTDFFYSTTNYYILGAVVEQVSQKPFQTFLEETFFQTLGMENTFVIKDEHSHSYLPGYYTCARLPDGADEIVNTVLAPMESCEDDLIYAANFSNRSIESAEYVIISTLNDLMTWSQNLYTGAVLGEAQTQKMMTITSKSGYYGLGVMELNNDLGTFYGHTGGGFGQSRMWYSPDLDINLIGWVSLESKPDFNWLTNQIFRILNGDEVEDLISPDKLIESLASDNLDTRVNAAEQLGQLGLESTSAAPDLINMLQNDPESAARSAAAKALGFIGQGDSSAKDTIFTALTESTNSEENTETLKFILLSIGFIRHEGSATFLESYIDSADETIKDAAQMAYKFAQDTP